MEHLFKKQKIECVPNHLARKTLGPEERTTQHKWFNNNKKLILGEVELQWKLVKENAWCDMKYTGIYFLLKWKVRQGAFSSWQWEKLLTYNLNKFIFQVSA